MRRSLRIVVLGLSLSSSWGNGHATTYRALLKALSRRGHDILFLERDVPWYAAHRDLPSPGYCRLELYDDVADLGRWESEIADADAVIVGSYVPDGCAVAELVHAHSTGIKAFLDIDTPVTLARLERGDCDYLSRTLIPGYDLYLSFTGGPTLEILERQHGARSARALYCSVDADAYQPGAAMPEWDLGYLGTYSEDRQPVLERLLIEPARAAPHLRFVVAGPQYPETIDWPANVARIDHVPPADHPAFYGRCRFTLNVTRRDMVAAGYAPSVRLFEAAACGSPIISDTWPGIETFFRPGRDIILADQASQVLDTLQHMTEPERRAIAERARCRILQSHTADRRAAELEEHLRHSGFVQEAARRGPNDIAASPFLSSNGPVD